MVNGSEEFTNIPRYCRTNYDGLGDSVGFEDFLLFAAAWGKSEGQGGYEQRFDLSGNRVVDEPDSAIFVDDYGKTCAQLPKPVMPLLAQGKNREARPRLSVHESGNEVHVDVLLNHATALAGYEAALGYDAAALEYIGIVDEGGLLHQQGEDAVFDFVKEDRGSLLIVAALKQGHEAATGSGSLTRIAFRKRGALADVPVWLNGLKVADDDAVVDHLMAGDETAHALEESENLWITSLGQNTPNPFNPATAIAFTLSNAGAVDLVIYNALGQEVRRLLSGTHLSAGSHQVIWDGRDALGRAVSSGIYMYRMKTDGFDAVQRMVMLK